MILFLGTESNGFFAEETANQFNMEVKYSGALPSLEVMKYEALSERYEYIIIDVASLPFETEEIRDTIAQIALGTQGKLIVYAQGYLPDARLVQECAAAGIEYFLLSNSVSTLRAELERALKGQPTPLPVPVTKTGKTDDTGTPIASIMPIGNTIAVAGSLPRIGVTTQCIQICKYLLQKGHSVAYVELNETGYLACMKQYYIDYETDPNTGRITFENVDFYTTDHLADVLKMPYEYIVYDFGSTTEPGFNLTSFLEKAKRIIVCGSNPPELQAMSRILDSFYKDDMEYLFSFVSEQEQADVTDQMGDRKDHVYFANYTPDPFCYSSTSAAMYDKLLPVSSNTKDDVKAKGSSKKEKKAKPKREHKGLFGKKKGA